MSDTSWKNQTAYQRFKMNDRVRLSDYARESNICSLSPYRNGTIHGFSKCGNLIRVVKDGTSTPQSFYHGFWEHIK